MSDKTLLNDAAELRRLTSWVLYRLGGSHAKRQGGGAATVEEKSRADARDGGDAMCQTGARRAPVDRRQLKFIKAGEDVVMVEAFAADREGHGERMSGNLAARRSSQAVA